MAKDPPETGNGKTGGKKPAKLQVTVKTKSGTFLPSLGPLFGKKTPKPPKAAPAKPVKAKRPPRNPMFDPN